MSESQTKAGNQRKFENLKFFENLKKFENLKFKIAQVDPRDMLNNFCFHLYAQKSLFIGENCNAFFLPQHHPIHCTPVLAESEPGMYLLIFQNRTSFPISSVMPPWLIPGVQLKIWMHTSLCDLLVFYVTPQNNILQHL